MTLHRLWNTYFRTPPRVFQAAKGVVPKGQVLGIHYRGTDKQTATWDSNPISPTQYLSLIKNFLHTRTEFDTIFAATDEFSFIEQLRRSFDLPVVALGEVEFHMSATHTVSRSEKADRAMLDCVLLSQCDCVLETSSALPSFAKLLNPKLEIYRCAASKLFGKLYTNMPYFPVAHIPVIPLQDEASTAILHETMNMDYATGGRAISTGVQRITALVDESQDLFDSRKVRYRSLRRKDFPRLSLAQPLPRQ